MALSLLHDLAPSTAISTEVRFSAGIREVSAGSVSEAGQRHE
jgi:hypothetical protein